MAQLSRSGDGNLDKLSQNIEKVRELGISHGLDDGDIDYCIQQVFSQNEHEKFRHISICLKIWRVIKTLFCLWFVCACVYTAGSSHKPTNHFFSSLLQPYAYPIGRMVRLMTLPLTKRIDISDIHDSDCLINNPLFSEAGLVPCDMCDEVTEVEAVENMKSFKDAYYNTAQPALLSNAIPREVSIDDLINLYRKNREAFSGQHGSLISSDTRLRSLADVFDMHTESSIKKKKSLHVVWKSKRLTSAQEVRRLFPRPQFVPSEAEIAIEKILLIDGINSAPYSFPHTNFANAWYVQASGSRLLYFYPAVHCITHCQQFQIHMEPRSILYYNSHFWHIDSVAVDSEVPSVGFIGSFT